MATIKELYQNAGNPNLTHWKDVKLLSIAEASLLTCAINPIDYEFDSNNNIIFSLKSNKPINWMYCLTLMRALVEAISTQELKSPSIVLERENDFGNYYETFEQSRVSIDDISSMSYLKTRIHRDELHRWLKKCGYVELTPRTKNHINDVQYYQQEIIVNNDVLLLPEPTYTTPALEVVQKVIKEFWEDFDPSKGLPPPKQEYVKQWIADNHPQIESDVLRVAIDKICRHPEAKSGGCKKI